MIIRSVWIALGSICLILGVIGIFVPGLPTTPFLLLTAGLYVRSSDKLYQWLIRNPYIGKYITRWESTRRLTVRTKVTSVLMMWVMITLSVVLTPHSVVLHLVMAGAGLIGTVVMGFIIPTGK
jgi:uncharacterized membrane protein YbaN (DUF454 family)